ncbi:helix-turn-helix domain-containing protein [Chromobacterium haemolyticum]|uniref:helix-turn-helix domain-containing protein n=1 Tax=Chromobacterium TaxID=535 RepID=UPI004056193D
MVKQIRLNNRSVLVEFGIRSLASERKTQEQRHVFHSSAVISRYETGVIEPPFGMAVRLAEALHLPTAYFYCEDDELAKLVLAWGLLSKNERKHIQAAVDTLMAGKHGE